MPLIKKITVIFNDPIETAGENAQDGQTGVDLSTADILQEINFIRKSLEDAGYEVELLRVANAREFIKDLLDLRTDLIYNFCEVVDDSSDQEIYAAGLYELLRIPYTGAPPMTLGLCLNKAKAKIILSYHGIPTAKFHVFSEPLNGKVDNLNINFPLIVKPICEDASSGISDKSVVNDHDELIDRVNFIISNFKQPALVEQFIDGREINVAILGNSPPVVLPISEIDFSELPEHLPKIVSYDAKWAPDTEYYQKTRPICPAKLEPEIEMKAKEIAVKCYKIMGCRDYARVDIRIDDRGNLYVLEVNPNPDLSRDAGFMRSASAYGLTHEETIVKIAELAIERSYKKEQSKEGGQDSSETQIQNLCI
jgi:D-alanine-D-alanine ligase